MCCIGLLHQGSQCYYLDYVWLCKETFFTVNSVLSHYLLSFFSHLQFLLTMNYTNLYFLFTLGECWICYDPDRDDAGEFITPCLCKGLNFMLKCRSFNNILTGMIFYLI